MLKKTPKVTQPSPDDILQECGLQTCNRIFRRADSLSFRLIFPTTGPLHPETFASMPSLECEQHYACSLPHLRACMDACFDEHFVFLRDLWWWAEHEKYVKQSFAEAQNIVDKSRQNMLQSR